MANVITTLGGAALGAGVMYLMDPDRGHRRRAELRDAMVEVGESDLVERAVERARKLPSMTAVREIVPTLVSAKWPMVGALASSGRRTMPFGRRRSSTLGTRDWALLGGFVGAMAAGLWLVRRSRGSARGSRSCAP
jgi:hypothetical protein